MNLFNMLSLVIIYGCVSTFSHAHCRQILYSAYSYAMIICTFLLHFLSMYSKDMYFQVAGLIRPVVTIWADKWLLASMYPQMITHVFLSDHFEAD